MMQIIFISESKLKGKKRVNAVLDRYAKRIGNETWTTPITQEGLEVIKRTLKSISTKQTHVSCFKKTPLGNKFLFSIGKPIIRENESIPVHSHTKKKKIVIPQYIKDATILTKLAGLFHDLGKVNIEFQNKIALTEEQKNKDRSLVSDSVRHELISFYLFNQYEKDINIDFNTAWEKANSELNLLNLSFINNELSSWQDLVRFLIITHHKLPINKEDSNKPFSMSLRNNLSPYFKNKEIPKKEIKLFNHKDSENELFKILKAIRFIMKRLNNKNFTDEPNYWFAMSYICRSHFILSDHEQSGISLEYKKEITDKHEDIFANTHINNKNQRVYFNQKLNWHLENVAERASQLIIEINNMKKNGLSEHVINNILSYTDHPRFSWQNKSMDFMSKIKENTQALILNIAGTGRGKTRSNVSTLASLNKNRNDNKPFRISTLLNLKTLTLQTIDAYKEQLNIPENEIAGVIGDSNTMALHNFSKKNNNKELFLNSDELDKEDDDDLFDDIDIYNKFDIDTPEFLDLILDKSIVRENKKINLIKTNRKSQILATPVLVSTIDFMINAGDISKQKKHSLAFLRLMNSDLILDEIDSYDPNALVAVSRLIMLSSMFGNNIIASSATLSENCAELIFNAYRKGTELRKSLINEENIESKAIIIDDRIPVISLDIENTNDFFKNVYSNHLQKYFQEEEQPRKIGKILDFEKDEESLFKALYSQINDFHEQWKHPFLNKKISFGLIRIANINQAVHVAKILSSSVLKDKIKICCYHSQLTTLHRHYIEEKLDLILKRKATGNNYEKMDIFIKDVNSAKEDDVIFIVVATSVEEIGRDHDFDWCICEPSSTQSIVQTAGRVNRHREIIVDKPNFAILNYNFRGLRSDKVVFCKPGLDDYIQIEQEEPIKKTLFGKKKSFNFNYDTYESYSKNNLGIDNISMKYLINENHISKKLDASLKFEKINGKEIHIFSLLDNIFLKNHLKDAFEIFNNPKYSYHFFNSDFYSKYTLRDKKGVNVSIQINKNGSIIYFKDSETPVNIEIDDPIDNSFLNISDIEKNKRSKLLKNYGLPNDVIKFTCYKPESLVEDVSKYHYHPNFGLYKPIL